MRFFATALVLVAGCAAPMTHGQPVETVAKGQWQVGAAGGVSASTGVVELLDLGSSQAKSLLNQQLACNKPDRSDCAKVSGMRDVTRSVYASGIGGGAEPMMELSVRYGLLERLSVGGRWMPGVQRLDVDYQLATGGPNRMGWQALLSLAYSHQSAGVPIPQIQSLLEQLGLADNGRHNLDVALATGKRLGDYGWLTFGARYLLGRYQIDLRPEVPVFDDRFAQVIVQTIPKTDEAGWSQHVGGFVNVLLGYKHVFAGVELSGVYYHAKALLLGQEETFSGVALLPSLIVLTRF